MEEDNDLAICALALIRRYGVEAVDTAQRYTEAHLALGEDETAAFWSALAQTIRRLTVELVGRR
jgi:hypothetical protein